MFRMAQAKYFIQKGIFFEENSPGYHSTDYLIIFKVWKWQLAFSRLKRDALKAPTNTFKGNTVVWF